MKLLLLTLGLTSALLAHAQLQKPTVDRRVELMAIVARLAEFREYNDSSYLAYVTAIHDHFDAFRDHPAVKMARFIRDSIGVGYSDVMDLAIHLKQDLTPDIPFTDEVPGRWGKHWADTMAVLLRQFYKDSKADAFFREMEPVYDRCVKGYQAIFDRLDAGWYQKYYGVAPHTRFHVVLGVGNGGGNYGPKVVYPDGREDAYAIEGVYTMDSTRQPVFPRGEYLPILIHEFNHSFVNYLSDRNRAALRNAGDRLFDTVQQVMMAQAYTGWQVMENEALVRASVVRYLGDHPADGIPPGVQITDEVAFHGFAWMRELVDLLGAYEADRKRYPTLESFMPEIIRFYDTLNVATVRTRAAKYLQDSSIQVVRIAPFQPGDTAVPSTLHDISFTFSEPVIVGRLQFGPYGKDGAYPTFKGASYSPDHRTLILHVDMKPHTKYVMYAGGRLFRSDPGGFPAKVYPLTFTTGD